MIMKKTGAKILNIFSSVLLAAAIMACSVMFVAKPIQAWSGAMASSFSSGSGTEASPYVIKTVEQFGYFMNDLNTGVTYDNTYIKIGANLDLTGESWTYTATAIFSGSLDGQCYTITSNYTILPDIGASGIVQRINATSTAMESSSLLCLDNAGTIQLCTVRGNAAADTCSGLICHLNTGTVKYCGAVGSARGSGQDTSSFAAMAAQNEGTLENCFSAMTVSASASGKYNSAYSHPLANGRYNASTTAVDCYYDQTLYTRTTTVGIGGMPMPPRTNLDELKKICDELGVAAAEDPETTACDVIVNATGVGMHEPYKLQLVIDMCGLPRVLLAAFISAVTRPFGVHGLFYKICGKGVGGIDGFYFRSSFERYKEIALINPPNPVELCNQLEKDTGIPVVLMDANDIDQNQLGKCDDFPLTDEEIQDAMADNPSGQGDELTPLILIRPLA